ncbi:MAG: ATP-binding protein [Elusimicrobiota bacterium]
MVKKIYWLTVYTILLSIVLSVTLRYLFKASPWFSVVVSTLISITLTSIILIFIFKPLKRYVISQIIFQEKYEETKNLLERLNKELEEKTKMLKQKTETLTIFYHISRAMISIFDLSKILDLIIDALKKELDFDRIIIFLLDDHTLTPKKGIGITDSELKKLIISTEDENNFIIKTVIEARPKIYTEIDNSSLPSNFSELYSGIKPELLSAIPLMLKDRVIGLLLVDNTVSQKKIEERDIRAASIFTNQAGLAIDNARLFELERSFTEELKRQIKIAKEKLISAQKRLIKAERLSALGEMAAIVAHEVRNPLSSIRASVQRIGKKMVDDDPNKKYTNYIMQESDRLDRVVKNLLTLTKEPAPQIQSTDINKLIEEILYFLKPEMTLLQIRLKKLLEPSITQVKLDPALMRQVLLNMIQNASHFMTDKDNKEIKVSTLQSNGNFVIEISDTGCGISKENIEKIFEPFFTTKSDGIGLGLTICHRIVESHNGKIEVETNLEHGATFRIIIPNKN